MRPLALLVALACHPTPEAAPLPADALPPVGAFRLDTTKLVAGQTAVLTATGLAPGATVHLALGQGGLGDGPCPAAFQGACAGVLPPLRVLGSRVASPAGQARFNLAIPANVPPGAYAFQAAVIQPGPAFLSNPLPVWVHPTTASLGTLLDEDGDGRSWADGDCNDADPAVGPGAPDPDGDGADRNCDGLDAQDGDGDGVIALPDGPDCDDTDPAIRPGAVEVCDGVDQDCDAAADDGIPTDGAGCRDPGPPVPPSPGNVLHVQVTTPTTANADSDTIAPEVCLSATRCFPLGNPNFDDYESGAQDVFVFEGTALDRASLDRLRIRAGGGTDAWRPSCVQVSLDGVPVHCADPGQWFGSSAGQTLDWTDPQGLRLACGGCDPARITHGPFPGAVGPTDARIWFRADATRRVEVRIGRTPAERDASAPVAVRYPSADRDFTEVVHVYGLTPDTDWHLSVTADGGPPATGQLHTAPTGPGRTRIAFGSCSRDDDQPIFAAIEAADPDLFLFIGDNHYGNTSALGDLRQFYRWAHSRPGRDTVMRSRPILATWDDHDYVGNNTTGASPGKETALRVFSEYWANAGYGTPATPGVFSTARWGDVEIFLLDDRYWRGLTGDILGPGQTSWLKARLQASDATFKLLASGSQWAHDRAADSWGEHPAAIQDLTQLLADAGVAGVVLLSGDVHRSEFRRVAGGDGGYTLPELTSSPLANTNAAGEPSNHLIAREAVGNTFVTLDVDTTLADPTLTATIRDEGGAALATWVIHHSELTPRPPTPATDGRADLDGDGYDDLVIGAPGEAIGAATGAGALGVLYGTTAGLSVLDDEFWSQDSTVVPGSAEAGDALGQPLATGDFDGDGFADVAFGVPAEDLGAIVDAGYVQVLYGSAAGLYRATDLAQGSDGLLGTQEANDRFGSALAAGDFDGDGYADLAIGVPREDGWGVVHVVYGGPAGLDGARDGVFDQASTGVNSANEAGDEYGGALAAGDFDGDGYADLAIGHPGEDLSATTDAGMLTVLYGGPGGLSSAGDQEWHQDTAGVPGTAEAGDRCGAALAAGDADGDGRDELAVACPTDDIDGAADAGLVWTLEGGAGGLAAAHVVAVDLSQPGMPGPGAGDRLGAALAFGRFDGDRYADLAVGLPGRSVGGDDDAGTALIAYGGTAGVTLARIGFLDQDPHPDAGSEPGDGHGSALGVGDFDADGYADLCVGAPGDDIGAVADAGMVVCYPGGPAGLDAAVGQLWHQDMPLVEGGAEAGDRFGAALP